ncbi:MAG: serine/threonine protein kinase [Candidatus Polarisedimenticolaceae bacterium]|nr:serine/threonine protein kinase [Candidatus Polarisedimenticolaceae bacterium]
MNQQEDALTRIQLPVTDGADEATRIQTPVSVEKTVVVPRQHQAESLAEADDATRLASTVAHDNDQDNTLQPGTLIKNRFQLVEELGRGGMGVVFTARDLVQEGVGEEHSLVAIKLLSDSFKSHPKALRMLQQETKKARELAHPNIITVYDFDRDGDAVFMTMELMLGESLEDYLKANQNGVSKIEEVAPMINDIAAGLKYAHANSIIHSDLKPGNIFLTDEGAKILDFGIARAMIESDSTSPAIHMDSSESAEVEALFALTPSYASLEMFNGEAPDPADDIYAFACICYQLLTGRHPYRRRSAEEAYAQGMQPSRIESLKEPQWRALLSGLALTRKERVTSVSDFLDGLLPKRREPWKQISLALALVAMMGAGYLLIRPPTIVEASLFENPPPAVEVTPQLSQQLGDMLEVAEVHMMVGRLLSPPGGNAYNEYQKILELHPYDRKAIAGLEGLLEQLAQLAMQSIEGGDLEQARKFVSEGLNIYADHKKLQTLDGQLKKLEKG